MAEAVRGNNVLIQLECSQKSDARVTKVPQKETFDDQETKTTET